MSRLKRRVSLRKGQLELPIERPIAKDRNADRGGRSFYFFDFDDNVAFLGTPVYIFKRGTGEELKLSSGEFARIHRLVGKPGPYEDYAFDFCDRKGTFRCFRDQELHWLEKLIHGKRQMFIEDLAAALGFPDVEWKGPSWSCFYHATLNQRPVSVITARGHHPETIKEGVRLFVDRGFLPCEPNYLSVYPVTHPEVRKGLGDSHFQASVASLKKAAIRSSVELAISRYGVNPYHRFGMSDDDPHNIELIVEAMMGLKEKYPEMSFFVIETQQGRFVKWEIYPGGAEPTLCGKNDEIGEFEQLVLLPES